MLEMDTPPGTPSSFKYGTTRRRPTPPPLPPPPDPSDSGPPLPIPLDQSESALDPEVVTTLSHFESALEKDGWRCVTSKVMLRNLQALAAERDERDIAYAWSNAPASQSSIGGRLQTLFETVDEEGWPDRPVSWLGAHAIAPTVQAKEEESDAGRPDADVQHGEDVPDGVADLFKGHSLYLVAVAAGVVVAAAFSDGVTDRLKARSPRLLSIVAGVGVAVAFSAGAIFGSRMSRTS